jgi:exosortase
VMTLAIVGLLVYFTTWFKISVDRIIGGQTDPFLNIGFIWLAVQVFWQRRQELARSPQALEEDRWIGYVILGVGLAALVSVYGWGRSVSLQSMASMMIVVAIGLSSWGVIFFRRFTFPIVLVFLALYPNLKYLTLRALQFLISEDLLERVMAWLGSISLSLIGYPATASGTLVSLSSGSVVVAHGCSGFDMAFTLVGVGFVMGCGLKCSRRKTMLIMLFGWALALGLNIPRIMLLAIASVYWGKQSFEFWHGPIGGQMFAMVMFTVYYYAVMWLVETRKTRSVN